MRLHAELLPLGCCRSHGTRRGWVISSSIDLAVVTILHADGWCSWSSTPAGEPSWVTPRTIGSGSFHPHPMPPSECFRLRIPPHVSFWQRLQPSSGCVGDSMVRIASGRRVFCDGIACNFLPFFPKKCLLHGEKDSSHFQAVSAGLGRGFKQYAPEVI